MTDEVANLVLEQLRNMRADMASVRADIARIEGKVDALADEVADMKHAMSGLAYLVAHGFGRIQEARLDRLEARP